VASLLEAAQKKGQTLLSADTTYSVLRAYGLPLIRRKVVTTADEATQVAKKYNRSVVLKIVSPDISHKSDVGGVMLGVEPREVGQKYQELMKTVASHKPDAQITGVEVMEMINQTGLEMIIGATTDPSLGKVVMVGLGGIYTEALGDVAWGLAPLTHSDVKRMIASLKAYQILQGARGQSPLAIAELSEAVARVSQLVTQFPDIKELDINPLKVFSQKEGALVLDARIIIF
jgi:acyl-CoA synthetase (NDP forming)